ncbi:hypothetical protein [uncultured Brachyspira sp.]|uniref:hypothetical protein n=1 Tax=uncultured Brachyspira sp. TaxID=221953 RepID=UPI0025F6800E|nr:hypothetical protein [uncultured Brachyspira sp.]
MKYKESIEVPFENVKDVNRKDEVKIKMTRGTRLVGTITDDAGVVKNFDFLFDYDEDIPDNTEVYLPIEIDGTTYHSGYYQTENDEWRFYIESDTECFNTKLILAEKILKQDEIALKNNITSLFDDLYWRIFYSGFHKVDYEDIPELCWYSLDTRTKKLIVYVEYVSLYMEILFIFKDSNDKKHFIRVNYSEGFAVLDEIYGEDQIRDSNRKRDYEYEFTRIDFQLKGTRDIPFTDNYLKQVKKKKPDISM